MTCYGRHNEIQTVLYVLNTFSLKWQQLWNNLIYDTHSNKIRIISSVSQNATSTSIISNYWCVLKQVENRLALKRELFDFSYCVKIYRKNWTPSA